MQFVSFPPSAKFLLRSRGAVKFRSFLIKTRTTRVLDAAPEIKSNTIRGTVLCTFGKATPFGGSIVLAYSQTPERG